MYHFGYFFYQFHLLFIFIFVFHCSSACVLGFYWVFSHRHLLPSMYQNSKLKKKKKKKKMFSTNCILMYKEFRHNKPCLSVKKMTGSLPKSKFTDASKGSYLQACLCKDGSQACSVTLYCIPPVLYYHTVILL